MARKAMIAIGIPGSGKSTYAAKLAKRDPGTCVVNPDSIRGKLYGYGKPGVKFDPAWEEKAWDKARYLATRCIAKNKNVFVDATNPDRFGRLKIIGWFDGSGFEIDAIRFVMEPGLAIFRKEQRGKQDVPDAVICEKYLALREPATWEGFDKVKYVGMPPSRDEIDEMNKHPERYDCKKILASP